MQQHHHPAVSEVQLCQLFPETGMMKVFQRERLQFWSANSENLALDSNPNLKEDGVVKKMIMSLGSPDSSSSSSPPMCLAPSL